MIERSKVIELVYLSLGQAMIAGGGAFDPNKVEKIGKALVDAIAGHEITGPRAGLSPASAHALMLSGMVAAVTREELNDERWKMINEFASETMRLGWKEG